MEIRIIPCNAPVCNTRRSIDALSPRPGVGRIVSALIASAASRIARQAQSRRSTPGETSFRRRPFSVAWRRLRGRVERSTFRRLAMRYRPSQAVRRFDRQTRRWIAGGISAPRGWFPAGRPRDWPGRLVRVTRRDPCQPRQWVGEYRRPCRQGRTEVGVAAPLDFAVGRLKPRPRSRGQFRRSVAFLLVTSLEYV